MKRHSLQAIDKLLGPSRVAAAKANARGKMEAMLLSEVRKQLGFTQTAVAKAMGVSQSALSQMESQDDLQLSTLRRLVSALGGELDIVARFGDRAIVLVDAK
ncbi:MAG TPA: helix-turn-helix transcriptional regulator [Tepidisphaeraceae bacterium]|nr:helix-turn-helix transcriptional regulator [Tepidisphaeraceae bacterium]